nr:hypothetical protein [Tanacetum cinerariifolium]
DSIDYPTSEGDNDADDDGDDLSKDDADNKDEEESSDSKEEEEEHLALTSREVHTSTLVTQMEALQREKMAPKRSTMFNPGMATIAIPQEQAPEGQYKLPANAHTLNS